MQIYDMKITKDTSMRGILSFSLKNKLSASQTCKLVEKSVGHGVSEEKAKIWQERISEADEKGFFSQLRWSAYKGKKDCWKDIPRVFDGEKVTLEWS